MFFVPPAFPLKTARTLADRSTIHSFLNYDARGAVSVPDGVEGLISGMFADVTFYTESAAGAVAIPSEAILTADGGEYLLVDTVGFIRKLPTELVEAFHSTLEEAALADELVIVSDASSPVEEVLQRLDAVSQPRIDVLNKCDAAPAEEFSPLPKALRISAKTGEGLDRLTEAIAAALRSRECKVVVHVPFDRYALIGEMRAAGRVLEEEYLDDGVRVTAMLEPAAYGRLAGRYPQVFSGEARG